MRKLMTVLVLMLGLTFIYNPQNNSGFVYINNDPGNWIILVDANMNVLRYYRATPAGEQRLDYTIEAWINDQVNKGLPFKSMIIPFRSQQQQGR